MPVKFLNSIWILLLLLSSVSCSGSDSAQGADGGGDGSADLDADADMDNDVDGDTDTFDECASIEEQAENIYEPADIIFVIDNTPSMDDEIAEVRANMNQFSKIIMESGIDVRIAIISCLPGDCEMDQFFGICIDPPLGASGGCQGDPTVGPVTDDTNLPQYKHLSTRVPSVKDLRWIVETCPDNNQHTDLGWYNMIRENSVKHFVVISDDGDEWSAAQFNEDLLALDPLLKDYFFHGIFAYLSKDAACAISSSEPCCTYAAPEKDPPVDWHAYADLVEMRGGVSGDLCLQDFYPVFEAISSSVIINSEISCEWVIPDPPNGEELDPDLVNVEFRYDNGTKKYSIGRIGSQQSCGQVEHAWYYDNPQNPTRIYVCPQTCDWFKSKPDAEVSILFGCKTDVIVE